MKQGLTEEEVIKNREQYGSNALENIDKRCSGGAVDEKDNK